MKRIVLVAGLMVLLLLGGAVRQVNATWMDPVTFYVVDDDTGSNDDSVTLSFDYYNWGNDVKLQYSLDNSSWSNVSNGSMSVNTGTDNWQQVWLRLADDDGNSVDTDGDVTFSSLESNSGLYNSVSVVWSQVDIQNYGTIDINISVGTANDDDNIGVVPAVPVPAAIWLLGSGLLGLAVFRRRPKE